MVEGDKEGRGDAVIGDVEGALVATREVEGDSKSKSEKRERRGRLRKERGWKNKN